MSSWDRPSKSSFKDLVPPSVSNSYSFSTATHGSSLRLRASSSLRLVSSFSSSRSSLRRACHSSWVAISCSAMPASFRSLEPQLLAQDLLHDLVGPASDRAEAGVARRPVQLVLDAQDSQGGVGHVERRALR